MIHGIWFALPRSRVRHLAHPNRRTSSGDMPSFCGRATTPLPLNADRYAGRDDDPRVPCAWCVRSLENHVEYLSTILEESRR